jgi:4-amino-4-deoxy-L-arabinose transferase-like glycosyltransferase
MDTVRRINPHADIGVIRPDGNINMIVHAAEPSSFPWRGTELAVRLVRFFSIILGMGTVLVSYQLAREVFPQAPVIHLGTAALVAFLPMFIFISGSVNNDNLSNLIGNLLLLLIVRLLKSKQLPSWHDYTFIGLVVGTGLLAKFNIGFLIPIVALTLLILSIRFWNWRPLVIGGSISGGLTIALAAWWYWRNFLLYGDPTGLNIFLDIVGRRAVPANAAQLWSERHSFTQAFWGFFGGMNVLMPEVVYLIFNTLGGLGLLSGIIYVGYALWRQRRGVPPVYAAAGWLPVGITLLWPAVTFISYIRWTAETPASQGRLVFAALSCIMMWMVVGLTWWLGQRIRSLIMGAVVIWFAGVALLMPFTVIRPAYALPDQINAADGSLAHFQTANGVISLHMARILSPQVHPEDYVLIETQWQVIQPLDRDWSLFVHLVTPDGVIIGQRDVYPGQGKLATSDLQPGRAWINPLAVWVPAAAYAPMLLDVNIGWYHMLTGERLQVQDAGQTYQVGRVMLVPREDNPFDVPNPIRVNFGGRIELVGYRLTRLAPAAADSVELTLFWRGLQPVAEDYKVFTHIIDPLTLSKYAASDGMPVQWNAPTSAWEPGMLIEDIHLLDISRDAPPGIYELEVGLYLESTGERLRILTPDGGQADNVMRLTRVRIRPLESGGVNDYTKIYRQR